MRTTFELIFQPADRWIINKKVGVALRVNEQFALWFINIEGGNWELM
jgi:hypothetical protein